MKTIEVRLPDEIADRWIHAARRKQCEVGDLVARLEASRTGPPRPEETEQLIETLAALRSPLEVTGPTVSLEELYERLSDRTYPVEEIIRSGRA